MNNPLEKEMWISVFFISTATVDGLSCQRVWGEKYVWKDLLFEDLHIMLVHAYAHVKKN